MPTESPRRLQTRAHRAGSTAISILLLLGNVKPAPCHQNAQQQQTA